MSDLVSISAAAKVIGIDKSVLSRYIADYPDLVKDEKGRSKLVNVAEVKDHREQNVNLLMSDNHKGDAPDVDVPADHSTGKQEPNYKNAKIVGEYANARMRQLDLAARLGQTLDTALVEAALADAGQMLVQAMEARHRLLGDELATMNDPRAIAARLKLSDREVLEKVSDALVHALRPDAEAAAA